VHPVYRLIVRWSLIVVLTAIAFRHSFAALATTTREGGIGGYVWTIFPASVLVALGVARRNRTELPIHDRQTDIIVGIMGLVLALLIQSVLLPRYALYFYLLRLDLLALWLFVLCCTIVLFGLRPVFRFAWVWGMLLLVFSLPYYLTVIFLGGGKFAAGSATLIISGLGTGIALGPSIRRGAIGSAASWGVGFTVLTIMTILFPDAPLVAYQQIPALSAIVLVNSTMELRERGGGMRLLDRKVEPLAAKQVWRAVPLVVAVAIALAVMPLPTQVTSAPISRNSPDTLSFGRPLVAPDGWETTKRKNYPDVKRLYGDNAALVRQWMTAQSGDHRFDKMSRRRTIVVDSLVSQRPFSFDVYPGRILYGLTGARLSAFRPVDLGMGVTGQMLSVVDDHLLVTWNGLQFAWGDGHIAQRVTIFASDNHEPDAEFPEPSGNMLATVRTLLTLLFRGNAVLDQRTPNFKDAELLTQFGQALVAAQFTQGRSSG
jgi:hypothetical protein